MRGGSPTTPILNPPPGMSPTFTNPITNRGPMEGRPPGEIFAHQRWEEFFPKVGYVLTLGQIAANQCFYPGVFPSSYPQFLLDLCHGPLRLQHALRNHAAAPDQGPLR